MIHLSYSIKGPLVRRLGIVRGALQLQEALFVSLINRISNQADVGSRGSTQWLRCAESIEKPSRKSSETMFDEIEDTCKTAAEERDPNFARHQGLGLVEIP